MPDILIFIQNHMMLVAALIIVLIILMIVEWIKQKSGALKVNPNRVTQLINHHDAAIIDIRNRDTYLTGHIVGAISIPYTELMSKLKKLDKFKSKPLIIVCATGIESPRAASHLMKNGFNTFILAGGIRAWKEAELPLIKG